MTKRERLLKLYTSLDAGLLRLKDEIERTPVDAEDDGLCDAKRPPEDDSDLEGALRALVPQALPQRVAAAAQAIREEIRRALHVAPPEDHG